ncbi:T-cell antigen CD7 [Paroedura picta]|uniref:T-cell antigen CD7 n=1 Tax=Paroedura picta TaxID=143630 RepID=UPI004056DFE1
MPWMLAICFLLFFPRCSASDENAILQEPTLITVEEGESVNITCHFKHPDILGLYFRQKLVKDIIVLYALDQGKKKTIGAEYKGRIEYFEQQNTVTIMMQQLQKNDSGNYTCDAAVLINMKHMLVQGRGTILAVTAKKVAKCSSSSWVLYILVIETLLLATALGYFILSQVNVKKYCRKGKATGEQNIIYEDMTCSLRSNTVANQYEC